ncbi:crispr-associated protein cas2 : CRISPR-associated endoribonuclease Cas2 OS=Singulisphaera acidiphila (strain ATCC BAA-1392 / DSM 18658 / VKM B-2454 / MOB10) GN=cas2 PE=3 SV=1: CRISPR_Cas2 [Gemmata massiliana]|uniref:CRISPR-associated endoribonuclease Cas2 n=1 Tax=Gemmata massiliana TaxID=1210884 RepID=A0A6P2CWS9_9BACT|nr:CRISPR-associated endonuclease Cas2 [Gemmata massiliana]VTR93598.1 crispr-associated protein cas2 : CRISPR-associated endoribonuclease Cas2 OS=Singulisphaera acidiphila (strain ATCC BAA-1392 / DSM 18658 / VKM B-2454 / MOB10) GN=cas2 PE=3 SV=1: CRISPR_Cas2 [Gemmata massiliana]
MDSYLVCYDISNPKRLRRVARTCEDFGYRKQLSVFLVRVGATDFVRLRSRLYDIIDLNEDQVLFLPLTETSLQRMEAIGRPTDAYDKNDVVMIL